MCCPQLCFLSESCSTSDYQRCEVDPLRASCKIKVLLTCTSFISSSILSACCMLNCCCCNRAVLLRTDLHAWRLGWRSNPYAVFLEGAHVHGCQVSCWFRNRTYFASADSYVTRSRPTHTFIHSSCRHTYLDSNLATAGYALLIYRRPLDGQL